MFFKSLLLNLSRERMMIQMNTFEQERKKKANEVFVDVRKENDFFFFFERKRFFLLINCSSYPKKYSMIKSSDESPDIMNLFIIELH